MNQLPAQQRQVLKLIDEPVVITDIFVMGYGLLTVLGKRDQLITNINAIRKVNPDALFPLTILNNQAQTKPFDLNLSHLVGVGNERTFQVEKAPVELDVVQPRTQPTEQSNVVHIGKRRQ